jgi:hypothetical protein
MKMMDSREANLIVRFSRILIILGCAILGLDARYGLAQEFERVISVTAEQYHYTPQEITAKKGEPMALEFRSLDVLHGKNDVITCYR